MCEKHNLLLQGISPLVWNNLFLFNVNLKWLNSDKMQVFICSSGSDSRCTNRVPWCTRLFVKQDVLFACLHFYFKYTRDTVIMPVYLLLFYLGCLFFFFSLILRKIWIKINYLIWKWFSWNFGMSRMFWCPNSLLKQFS